MGGGTDEGILGSLAFYSLHKNFFKCAAGGDEGLNFTLLGAQEVQGMIGLLSGRKRELHSRGCGTSGKFAAERFGDLRNCHSVAFAGGQILDFSL